MQKTYCWIVLAILSFLSFTIYAQNNKIGTIKGIVIDESTRQPVEFVTVVLQNKADSIYVMGTVTDKNGKFKINNIPEGEYLVKFRLISYKEKNIKSVKIDQQHITIDLGKITLIETAINLDEVLITSQKAMFNNSIDRKVYNVEQDIMSKTGSVSEVLQNVPSIEVDIEGNVSLRGSSNVLILIDGKTSPLMGKSRATVLQQMPASSIEKIEVITNPSAKYKPDGTSGIINIVMKKNMSLGFNGSVTANAGVKDRYNANVILNYSPGDFNLFGSYSIRKDNRNRFNTDTREEIDNTSNMSHYKENLSSNAKPLSHMFALGGEYKFDEFNNAGLSANYFFNSFDRNDYSNVSRDSNQVMFSNYNRNRFDAEYEKEIGLIFFVQHNFPDKDHKIRFELITSEAPEVEDNHYTNIANVGKLPDGMTNFDNTLIKQTEKKKELTLEYSNPLSEHSNLEAGYTGEFNNYDLDFFAEYKDSIQHSFIKDNAKTNHFLLDETINAIYATFEHSFGSFGIMTGLRAEQAYLKSHLITNDTTIGNEYFGIYPTIHLSYKFSEAAELQLNYSKRTRRPEADELNPFPEYRDPQNVSRGNPNLLPEYIHSIELGCKLQNDAVSILPSLYYRYTYNRFTSVTNISDSISITTQKNLSNDQSLGAELIVSASLGNSFTTHASVNAFYNQINASNLGYSSDKSNIAWSGAITANLHVTETTIMQMKTNYNPTRLTPQGEILPSYVFNLGMRQELMDGKMALVLTVADLFKTQKRETKLNTPLIKQTVVNSRDSQIIYFGITYHFGIPPKKSKDESLHYDDGI